MCHASPICHYTIQVSQFRATETNLEFLKKKVKKWTECDNFYNDQKPGKGLDKQTRESEAFQDHHSKGHMQNIITAADIRLSS